MTQESNPEPDEPCLVVVNELRQYSVWPADTRIPAGWEAVGEPRSRSACLAHIAQVWTDIRPVRGFRAP